MKVVIVSDFADVNGGAAKVAVASARGLVERGTSVTFIHGVAPRARLVGLAAGVVSLGFFGWNYHAVGHEAPLMPLLVLIIVLAAVLHGHELRPEELLHTISHYVQSGAFACP